MCFLYEAIYDNYINRLKTYSLKRYFELDLDIPVYISTNDVNKFSEYANDSRIRIFDINELRRDHPTSFKYENLPSVPPENFYYYFPLNLRRFIMKQAIEDGYTSLFALECDVKIMDGLDQISFINWAQDLYEPNTVKTSCSIYPYPNSVNSNHLHCSHDQYISDLNLNFEPSQYDTPDGPMLCFFGKDTASLQKFYNIWDELTTYGYEKPYGYTRMNLSNLSFTIPMSGFRLQSQSCPFQIEHHYEDRY